jgi:hypothetical protein
MLLIMRRCPLTRVLTDRHIGPTLLLSRRLKADLRFGMYAN